MTRATAIRQAWRTWWSPSYGDFEGQPLGPTVLVAVLFNSAVALVLTAFSWVFSAGRGDLWQAGWTNFVLAQSIGFSIFGLILLAGVLFGGRRIDAWTGAQRAAFFALLSLIGVAIGYAIGFFIIGLLSEGVVLRNLSGWFVAGALMVWAVLTLLWWSHFRRELRVAEAEKQHAADRARAADLERQAVDAQLRTLQAQIEPHFLFNTLANVISLIERQPADARRMLERLNELLRGTLSASRARHATLGQELDLCCAYLDILSIRMGTRLVYSVSVPDELRREPLPPMLLQPLVENAIQHGLEPKVEGGRVWLSAQRLADGALELVVGDDGVGFGTVTRGGGVGLGNLRERLAAAYGGHATLAIDDLRPGTRVRLVLPSMAPVTRGGDEQTPEWEFECRPH